MSRMIVFLCLLAFAPGCSSVCNLRGVSLVEARLVTLGPDWRNRGSCGGCCDGCVPPKPLKCTYEPWWDYHVTENTAQRCAFRALKEYKQTCGRPVSHHFKSGFIAAYEDLALNRRPSPPVVPPPLYWNAYYRSCAGQGCVDDWFAGYDAGLEMGSNSGVSRFHEIYLRRCGGQSRCDAGYDDGYVDDQPFQQEPLQSSPQLQPQPQAQPYGAAPGPYGHPYGGRY